MAVCSCAKWAFLASYLYRYSSGSWKALIVLKHQLLLVAFRRPLHLRDLRNLGTPAPPINTETTRCTNNRDITIACQKKLSFSDSWQKYFGLDAMVIWAISSIQKGCCLVDRQLSDSRALILVINTEWRTTFKSVWLELPKALNDVLSELEKHKLDWAGLRRMFKWHYQRH